MDRRGAVADEAGEVVDAPALRRLGDERGPAAQASPDQVVVDGADGEQRRHVAGAGTHRRDAVAEDDDLHAVADGGGGLAADALDGLAQAPRPARDLVRGRDPGRAQPELLQRRHLRLVDDRRRQLHLAGVLRLRGEQVAARAELDGERHDEPLAQRVDGRVGHLGEALGEVVVEHVRLAGEDRQRRVVAHGEARLLGLPGHGPDDELDVLGGEAGRRLAAEEVAGVAGARGGRGGGRAAAEAAMGAPSSPATSNGCAARLRRCASSQAPYGRRDATEVLTTSSRSSRPCSRSTAIIWPGPRRPFSTISSPGRSTAPASEASASRPERVRA